MAVLGIDYGDRKVGLAISDSRKKFALPLTVLENTGQSQLISKLQDIIARNQVELIVVGLPLASGERDAKQEKTTEKFFETLSISLHIPIKLFDERFTTSQAKKLLLGSKDKKSEDAVAAMLILQSYLDKKNIQP